MSIKALIDELTEIYNEYGDIAIYQTSVDDGMYGCNYEIIDYMNNKLTPVQIYITEYEKEYYDYRLDDIVTEGCCEIEEAPLGTKLPPDAKEVHIGLIL